MKEQIHWENIISRKIDGFVGKFDDGKKKEKKTLILQKSN